MPPAISIIILNWNGKRFLDDCLGSLAAQVFRDFETILLDNGSTDGSAAHIEGNYPWVKLIGLPENLGFSGGNNRALQECRGDHIVTLNNDTNVEPGFLAELLKVVEADPGIGMVAAKMLNFYQPGRIDSVGIKIAANGMSYNIGVGEKDDGQYDAPAGVFGPCAGAALYRRSMLEKVGFFDPSFFAYYEDVDLAWRGRLAGWRCVTAPGAVVYHVHSATSGKMSPFTVYHVQRNKWFVILKNWPAALFLKRLPLIVSFDMASLVLAVLRGQFFAAIRARFAVLRSLPHLLRSRRGIKKMHRVTSREIELFFSRGAGALNTFRRKFGDL